MGSLGVRPRVLAAAVVVALLVWAPAAARAEFRIGALSVFLNDLDLTVHTVLLGAIPPSFLEHLQSGVPTHVRFTVEVRQQGFLRDPVVATRTVERQLSYNVLTKEYKVAPGSGEPLEPYLTKSARDAQRVISDLRLPRLVPLSTLDPRELYYVRVRAEAALRGANTWLARLAGEAAETPWVQSSLLTATRSQ
jgi:hypothetical protein